MLTGISRLDAVLHAGIAVGAGRGKTGNVSTRGANTNPRRPRAHEYSFSYSLQMQRSTELPFDTRWILRYRLSRLEENPDNPNNRFMTSGNDIFENVALEDYDDVMRAWREAIVSFHTSEAPSEYDFRTGEHRTDLGPASQSYHTLWNTLQLAQTFLQKVQLYLLHAWYDILVRDVETSDSDQFVIGSSYSIAPQKRLRQLQLAQ